MPDAGSAGLAHPTEATSVPARRARATRADRVRLAQLALSLPSISVRVIVTVIEVVTKMWHRDGRALHHEKQLEQDIFAGPDLWHTVQEIVVDAGEQHQRGIERLPPTAPGRTS